jgi:hypothetical protein
MPSMQRIGPGARATSIRTEGTRTVVRYHETDVVSFDASTIRLNSGGWRTYTTKARMNQASNQFGLGYNVEQDKGQWYVRFNGGRMPFFDGCIIDR